MRKLFLIAVLVAAWGMLMPAQASAHSTGARKKLCEGFLPENDMYIPEGFRWRMRVQSRNFLASPNPGGINQITFNIIIDRMENLYAQKVAKRGGRLIFNRLWTDGTVNASADRFGTTWEVNMYGGMARHPAMGEEGFALVACHEMGHHLGGTPTYPFDWASNEGESDYFSTLKCMRFVYETADNEAWLKTQLIDPHAQKLCTQQFTKRADQLLCLRASVGALQVARMLWDFEQKGAEPAFDSPDAKKVNATVHSHPASQCRLDTLFMGSTCTASRYTDNSFSNWKTGTCVQGKQKWGWRPRCWFKPPA